MSVDVLRVFCDDAGAHGNPLGIVVASAATPGREQEVAAALGFSETVVVDRLPAAPVGPAAAPASASVRIFTPAVELPFAGHPTVGTAWWLAARGTPVAVLEVPAGEVGVRYEGDVTLVTARPQWAPDFTWHDLGAPADVDALDAGAFDDGEHYAWAWLDETAGSVRARMFAPAMGIAEDEATGAAAVRLTGRLGRDLDIVQGAGSRLRTRLLPDGRVELGGRVVADGVVPLP